MGDIRLTYEVPTVELLNDSSVFFDQLFQERLHIPTHADGRALRIKQFIDNHPDQDGGNLDEVCRQLDLSMSGRQARRLFKVSTGMGIRDYARNRRLAVAVEQLRTTNIPIKVVAADLGYKSPREFRRRFKELIGLTPLEFSKIPWRRKIAVGLEQPRELLSIRPT